MKIDFKNKTFWVSLASAIVLFVQNISALFGLNLQTEGVMTVVNTICGALIVLGILNNPTKHSATPQPTNEQTNKISNTEKQNSNEN